MDSSLYGLVAMLTFIFLTSLAFMVWSYLTDKMKFEALKMGKELAEKIVELETTMTKKQGAMPND